MKLTIVRFVFIICALLSILNVIGIAIDHATGIDLLYRFANLCMSAFICAHYYEYMQFNHPSKKG